MEVISETLDTAVICITPVGETYATAPPEIGKRIVLNAEGFYRPELDVLRLCAFLLVFSSHLIGAHPSRLLAPIRGGGAYGVSVFFALSAYLITNLLCREKETTGHIDLRSFYIRRILRIWPLYFVALLGCFVLSRLVPNTDAVSFRAFLPYLLLLSNWPATKFHLLPLGFAVLWSIGVEEQFYLVWPLIVRWGRGALLWVLCLLWTISQLFVAMMSHRGVPYYEVWFSSLAQMQYFAIGAALSLLINDRVPRLDAGVRVVMVCLGLAMFLGFPRSEDVVNYGCYLSAGIGTTLIFVGFLGIRFPKWMDRLRYLGKISFGLYVFHSVVLLLLRDAIGDKISHGTRLTELCLGLPVTIAIAHISYRLFETPFLKLKERFEIVKSRTV